MLFGDGGPLVALWKKIGSMFLGLCILDITQVSNEDKTRNKIKKKKKIYSFKKIK